MLSGVAAPMLGGVASSLILVLIVFPAIYAVWRGRAFARRSEIKTQVKHSPRGVITEVCVSG